MTHRQALMAEHILHEVFIMKKVSIYVLIVHISSFLCLLLGAKTTMSLSYSPEYELIGINNGVVNVWFTFFVDYIAPVIYLVTLLYFVVMIIINIIGFFKNKKNNTENK